MKKKSAIEVSNEIGAYSPKYDYLEVLEMKVKRYEKALKEIAESVDDSSCNELALKYEVIAEQALSE